MSHVPNAAEGLLTTDRRRFLEGLFAAGLFAGLPRVGHAGLGDNVSIKLHDKRASGILNRALTDESYWSGATTYKYDDELYDEIRLKPMGDGYLTMITGEGNEDFEPEQVGKTVFAHQDKLPRHMDGAKALPRLGGGTDGLVGAPYCDRYFLADFALFYGEFFQRSYDFRLSDGRVVIAYEKITQNFLDANQWAKYRQRRDEILETVERRWAFSSIVEITHSYGMFVVSPGKKRQSRVTLVAQLRFGEGSGMIAQMGSKMPPVLKAGMQSGFDASVAVARLVQSGKYK
jgi:hypothetical protein